MKMKKISATAVVLSLSLVAGTSTIYAITPSEPLITTAAKNSIEIDEIELNDPTLGGIFELYTPEEYAEVIENIKKYGADDDKLAEDIKSMEENLERLKADNGKGEFVIYKGAFRFDKTLENGAVVAVALNPTIIMAPELLERDTPITAESYKNDIQDISHSLDTAIKNGNATLEQKQIILNKMNQNLLKLK